MELLLAIFLDQERRLRTVWRFIIYGIGFVAIAIFVQIVIAIGLVIYYLASRGQSGGLDERFADWMERFIEDEMWLLMAMATPPMTALLFAFTCLCRRFIDWRPIRSMGYVMPESRVTSAVWAGFLWGVAPILAAIGLPWLLGGFELERVGLPIQVWVMLPTLVMAAFHEEFVFRGYVLQNLLDIRRPVYGVLFSSVVFWLIHAFNPSAWSSPLIGLNLFGAGVLLALAYMASGNIWFPTAMHFGWNMAQGVLLSVPISGIRVEGICNLRLTEDLPSWLTGGDFGLEGSILVTLVEALLIGVFLAVLISRRKAAESTVDAEVVLAEPNPPVFPPLGDPTNPYQSPEQH
jgi:membrane protease YdiL (CAAX protease family)